MPDTRARSASPGGDPARDAIPPSRRDDPSPASARSRRSSAGSHHSHHSHDSAHSAHSGASYAASSGASSGVPREWTDSDADGASSAPEPGSIGNSPAFGAAVPADGAAAAAAVPLPGPLNGAASSAANGTANGLHREPHTVIYSTSPRSDANHIDVASEDGPDNFAGGLSASRLDGLVDDVFGHDSDSDGALADHAIENDDAFGNDDAASMRTATAVTAAHAGSANGLAPQQSTSAPASRRVYTNLTSVTVGTPQKIVEGTVSFVTYLVTSEHKDQAPERVRRRFSDFVRLYTQLVAEYPAAAVPPLPDYSRLEYIAGDRFGSEFTNRRAASLQRFLFRLTQHPDLGTSRALAAFLAPRDLSARPHGAGALLNGAADAANGILGGNADGSGLVDALSDSLLNAFVKVKYQSKEMLEARERADRFEHNVATVDKAFLRMARRQADIVTDLGEMYKQSSRLARLEPRLGSEFDVLARTAKAVATAMADLHGTMDTTFAGALRDMMHYVQAIKALLKQREQRQIDYEALVEYQQRSEAELVAAQNGTTATTSSFLRTKVNDLRGIDKEQVRQGRVARLADRIAELKTEVAKAKTISNQFEEVAKREVAVFESTEALELKTSLGSIVDGHIAFYSQVVDDCRKLEREFLGDAAR